MRVSVCVLAQQQPWKENWGVRGGPKAEGRGKSCKYENLDGAKPWWICIYATSHYKIFMMLTHNNCYHREETLSSSVWLCKQFYKRTEMDMEHFLCCFFSSNYTTKTKVLFLTVTIISRSSLKKRGSRMIVSREKESLW